MDKKEDFAKVLDGVLPTADTDVAIPASSATRPDMTGRPAKSVTFVATSDVSLRGDCTVPAIVKSAKAWYDFDDSTSVTMEGGIPVGVANKGTAGNALDLVLYHPEESRRKPAYGLSSHYGRDVMSFTNSYGFVSKNAAGIVGDADRTLVAVSLRIRNTYPAFNDDGTPKEDYEQQMFPIGIEKVGGNWQSGEFRLGQWAGSSNLDYDDSTVTRADWTTQALQGLRNPRKAGSRRHCAADLHWIHGRGSHKELELPKPVDQTAHRRQQRRDGLGCRRHQKQGYEDIRALTLQAVVKLPALRLFSHAA